MFAAELALRCGVWTCRKKEKASIKKTAAKELSSDAESDHQKKKKHSKKKEEEFFDRCCAVLCCAVLCCRDFCFLLSQSVLCSLSHPAANWWVFGALPGVAGVT